MDNFAKRLLEACNASDEIPEYGKGQQTHLASLLNVSQEAVRKWFAGETVPRASMSMKLAGDPQREAFLVDARHGAR